MPTNQHLLWPAASASDPKGQVPSPVSADFVRTYNAQTHEIVDAIAALVTNAQAGLNWLGADPPDLEEVREALKCIANDGRRAAESVVRLGEIMEASTADAPCADGSEVAPLFSS